MKALKLLSLILLSSLIACSERKTEATKTVPTIPLEEEIIGSWTTEGSAEQIDDYLTAGYGQQWVFESDGSFHMLSLMSIGGCTPVEQTTADITATFSARINGKYSIKGNTLTITYDPQSITAEMDPQNIIVQPTYVGDIIDADSVRRLLVQRLESHGLTKESLLEILKESTADVGSDTYTNVHVQDNRLTASFEGSTIVYIRD